MNIRDAATGEIERSGTSSPGQAAFPTYEPKGDFPVKALPETIQGAVREACQNEQVPGAVAAQAALAAVSIACQDQILVQRAEGLESVCSLFLLTIMDTGGRKTQVDGLFAQGVVDFDAEMRVAHEEAMRQYEADFADWQDSVKGLRSAQTRLTAKLALLAAKECGDDEEEAAERALRAISLKLDQLRAGEPPKPRSKRRLYSQVSTRALEQCLYDNWPAAGLFSNEAADILLGKTMADMSRLDRLWDGQEIDVADVREKDRLFVAEPRLTLSLMIQPPIFDLFLKNKGEAAKGIGFMPRALIARLEPLYGERLIDSSYSRSTAWLKKFNEKVRRLLGAASTELGQPLLRQTLTFSPEAQNIWRDDYNEKERGTAEKGTYVYEREFVSRYSEHVARVAALFHYFESEGGSAEILPDTVKRAIEVCDWYLHQYSEVFNPEVSIRRDAALLLSDLIRRLEAENPGASSGAQTYGSQKMPVAYLSRYVRQPLRKDRDRFYLALEYLQRAKKVDVRSDYVKGSTKPTKIVELIIEPELFGGGRDRYGPLPI